MSFAQRIAKALDKGLIALHIVDPALDGPSAEEAEQAMSRASLPYMVLKGATRQVVTDLPTLLGAVIVVTAVDPKAPRRSPLNPATMLVGFAECKVAYLVVQQPLGVENTLRHVSLSVDHRRESKEKLLWASYMARFNHSEVEVCYRDYRDEGLRQRWRNNMVFLKKMFTSLGIGFSMCELSGRGARIDLDVVAQARPDMIISLATDPRERDVADLIVGTQERQLVVNPQGVPVLLLNPRDDLYVLCD